MSTQQKLASHIPPPRGATGNFAGTIDSQVYEANTIDLNHYEGVFSIAASHSDDTDTVVDLYVEFPDNIKINEELQLAAHPEIKIWLSYKRPGNPYTVQCNVGHVNIQHLDVNYFKVQGEFYGRTESPEHQLDIRFKLNF